MLVKRTPRARLNMYVLLLSVLSLWVSCAGTAISAEEYYAIGMAYFEMGNYTEAERWLTRALARNRTMRASEYNLGRIAYETGRYKDALRMFNSILKKDPDNVMALKAAAYTNIKLGNIKEAEKLYDDVLWLEPEEADNGVNYATVLYAMDKPAEAEAVLQEYSSAVLDDSAALLLLARVQSAQKLPKAIDNYDLWLSKNTDAQVRYEFAGALEDAGFYARSLEAARKTLEELPSDTATLKRSAVRFMIARLLLVSDPENADGMTELASAIREGFDDEHAIDALKKHEKLSKAKQEEVARTISNPPAATPAPTSETLDGGPLPEGETP